MAPILDRNEVDPFFVSGPTVIKKNDLYIMYYLSGLRWLYIKNELHSNYLLKLAFSHDGIKWERDGKIAVDFIHPNEEHIARMSVIEMNGTYEGWYSYECDKGYRIGMARSIDGIEWKRFDDEAGMKLSNTGWDSEAQAYPFVFLHKGQRCMLYNGNRNGFDGIGFAIEGDYQSVDKNR